MKIFLHEGDLPTTVKIDKEVAIDTETMGLNLIRDRLCLLQIKTNHEEIHLVQFNKNYDCPNLRNILSNRDILKIFHFARFDLLAIYTYLGIMCENIFCTKIASKLCRTYTDKHGLANLVKELLQKDLLKEQQSSNWGSAQISESQQQYAACDVLYLHELKDILSQRLMVENRYNLAKSCFEFLPTKVILDSLGFGDETDIYKH